MTFGDLEKSEALVKKMELHTESVSQRLLELKGLIAGLSGVWHDLYFQAILKEIDVISNRFDTLVIKPSKQTIADEKERIEIVRNYFRGVSQ